MATNLNIPNKYHHYTAYLIVDGWLSNVAADVTTASPAVPRTLGTETLALALANSDTRPQTPKALNLQQAWFSRGTVAAQRSSDSEGVNPARPRPPWLSQGLEWFTSEGLHWGFVGHLSCVVCLFLGLFLLSAELMVQV